MPYFLMRIDAKAVHHTPVDGSIEVGARMFAQMNDAKAVHHTQD